MTTRATDWADAADAALLVCWQLANGETEGKRWQLGLLLLLWLFSHLMRLLVTAVSREEGANV